MRTCILFWFGVFGFSLLSLNVLADTAVIKPAASNIGHHLREMQIFTAPPLGLKIWVENQPAWETQLTNEKGRAIFVAQSPTNYHPPTAMTYASFPKEVVADADMPLIASTAIERASQNFGLSQGRARNLQKRAAQYGNLVGMESTFVGRVEGVNMDVKIFVGQASGKFPVALSIYTIKDKMPLQSQVLRRAWTKLEYLN